MKRRVTPRSIKIYFPLPPSLSISLVLIFPFLSLSILSAASILVYHNWKKKIQDTLSHNKTYFDSGKKEFGTTGNALPHYLISALTAVLQMVSIR